MNYKKFSIATNCVNTQFHLKAFFFSLSTGVRDNFHDISQNIHDLHGIYMIFSMLFVFCTCRAHKWAENQTNVAENQKQKLVSAESAFCKSELPLSTSQVTKMPLTPIPVTELPLSPSPVEPIQ